MRINSALRTIRRPALIGALLLSWPHTALAHHFMSGEPPETLWQGMLAGLAHPVLGPDHLVFLAVCGVLLAARDAAHRRLTVLVVVGAGLLGSFLHIRAVDLPGVETAVALSVLTGGVLVVSRQLDGRALGLILGFAAVFHGYALAETVAGVSWVPRFAYLGGLIVMQTAIVGGSALVFHRFDAWTQRTAAVRLAPVTAAAALSSGTLFLMLSIM